MLAVVRPPTFRKRKSHFAILSALILILPRLAAAQGGSDKVLVQQRHASGVPSYVKVAPGAVFLSPMLFLQEQGRVFGINDPERQLRLRDIRRDSLGQQHTTYFQQHRGVPVFSGMIKVHQDREGHVILVNGYFHPIRDSLDAAPGLAAAAAAEVAKAAVGQSGAAVSESELVIVDPGWYGDPPRGARLAYYVVIENASRNLREAFFVDAKNGEILDRWSLLESALVRKIYEYDGSLPGTLVRSEADPPVVSPADANVAYDYGGDTYDYYQRAFGRDSLDGAGLPLVMTVELLAGCPNAYWNGGQMQFCAGFVIDDVTGHEMTHGLTEHTAGLIYQNEPGQLNESFSDVFGELVDLFNGNVAFPGAPGGTPWPTHPSSTGTDTPNSLRTACSPEPTHPDGVRWLIGEDLPGIDAIRDMWDPTCFGFPDRASSVLQTCDPYDYGGVHSGSSIPNHAFAILTDGKTFNGYTVSGIGPVKAAAVWYRALVTYLTPGSGFGDAYVAFNQAAADLGGTMVNDPRPGAPAVLFTASDQSQVDKALRAVELNLPGATSCLGACCNVLTGTCEDNVHEATCQGRHSPGELCASINPTCAAPGVSAKMIVVLDRTGSMEQLRTTTGNSRCLDALQQSKSDVAQFLTGFPGRSVDVWTFADNGPPSPASLTGGFVDKATALTALSTLDSVLCAGSTPLADTLCEAANAFPVGLPATDKIIAVNSDGDENSSDGPCNGPSSLSEPPPPGNYDPGSWQGNVTSTFQGQAVALMRLWGTFGGQSSGVDVETGRPVIPGLVSDSLFFQDLAGLTGGHFTFVADGGPLPPPFPLPKLRAVTEIPTLSEAALLVFAALLATGGGLLLRRRRLARH